VVMLDQAHKHNSGTAALLTHKRGRGSVVGCPAPDLLQVDDRNEERKALLAAIADSMMTALRAPQQ